MANRFRVSSAVDMGRDTKLVDDNLVRIEGFQNGLKMRFEDARMAGRSIAREDIATFVACEQVLVLHSIAQSLHAIRMDEANGG